MGAYAAGNVLSAASVSMEMLTVARFLDGSPYDAARVDGVILSAGSEALWDRLARRYADLA